MGNIYDVVRLLETIVKEHTGKSDAVGSVLFRLEDGKEIKILDFTSAKELEGGKDIILKWLVKHEVYPDSVTARIISPDEKEVTHEEPIHHPSLVFAVNGKLIELAAF